MKDEDKDNHHRKKDTIMKITKEMQALEQEVIRTQDDLYACMTTFDRVLNPLYILKAKSEKDAGLRTVYVSRAKQEEDFVLFTLELLVRTLMDGFYDPRAMGATIKKALRVSRSYVFEFGYSLDTPGRGSYFLLLGEQLYRMLQLVELGGVSAMTILGSFCKMRDQLRELKDIDEEQRKQYMRSRKGMQDAKEDSRVSSRRQDITQEIKTQAQITRQRQAQVQEQGQKEKRKKFSAGPLYK